jgi:YfiH family protein
VSAVPFDGFNLAHHVGDEDSAVRLNRHRLRGQLKQSPKIAWLNQTHSTVVVQAGHATVTEPADASYTADTGLACCVMTADCLPVFFWNRHGTQVAIAHAGWRGLANGILAQTLKTFKNNSEVICGLGPCIGPSAFEVGEDVKVAFSAWPNSKACFVPSSNPGKYYADLPKLAENILNHLGVSQVYRSDVCTVSTPKLYYSYRREGVTGRMANLIWKID